MVDFVVRSAYIDTRARNGYKNSTVIFAETSKDVRKFGLIVGCGVDTIDAKEYKVESLYFSWIWYQMGHLTHEEIMITCYDLEVYQKNMTKLTMNQHWASVHSSWTRYRYSWNMHGDHKLFN